MESRTKDKLITIVFILMLLIICIHILTKPANIYSNSERRVLTKKPVLSIDNIASGEYISSFEEYSLDQFPYRDSFRGIKAFSQYYIFNKKDNNKLYFYGDYVSKMEYPLNYSMLEYSIERFKYIYTTYLKSKNIKPYLAIIPDKNFFMATKSGHLALDYNALFDYYKANTPFMIYVDIKDILALEDYYYTDTHWKQENIVKVAEVLCNNMGQKYENNFEKHTLDTDFFGVYYGQSALDIKCDKITYLDNEIINNCKVYMYKNGDYIEGNIYNFEKSSGRDPYEMFLEGPVEIISINNPNSTTQKNLIIFRDSFASSLAPLLINNYQNITLVDIRYLRSDMLSNYVDFNNCDVLFLYNTSLLNNCMAMK